MNRKRAHTDENSSSPEKKPKVSLYLDDYTPVRTIKVTNLPEYVSEEYLRGFFEREGQIVEKVEIVGATENHQNELAAYVTFFVPEDAAALISDKDADADGNHRISRLFVKVAEPSRQPKIDPEALNMEGINDHCLLYIMSQLPLIDIVNLSKVSTRLQTVSQMCYKKYSNFSFGTTTGDSSINETNLPTILEAVGSSITSIEWHSLGAAQLELLTKYCPKVTKIKLSHTLKDLSTATLTRNKAFFAKLKRLHVESATLCDGSIKAIISGRKLKTLDVSNCRGLRGKFLNTLNRVNLKNIRIVGCRRMNTFSTAEWKNQLITYAYDKCCSYLDCLALPPASLEKLKELELDFSCYEGTEMKNLNLNALKKIRKFTITRKHMRNAVNFIHIIKQMAQLDTLQTLSIEGILIDNDTIECLKSIKNLKNLRMSNVQNTMGRNLYEVLRVKLSDLSELSISSLDVENVTGKVIGDMIAGLPKLNYFAHSSITWQLLDVLLQSNLSSGRASIKIGIPREIFNDPRKATFDAASNGAVVLLIHE